MKRYSVPHGRVAENPPEHPERTGYRFGNGMDFDVHFQVWPSAAALRKTIEMQEKSPPHHSHWRAYADSRWNTQAIDWTPIILQEKQ